MHSKLHENFRNLETAAFPKKMTLDYNAQQSHFDTCIE